MAKGNLIPMFHVGQRINYVTKVKFGHYGTNSYCETVEHNEGTITKLIPSGKSGVAFIKPIDGTKKVTRRLIHVSVK